jgi:hypothetical protein
MSQDGPSEGQDGPPEGFGPTRQFPNAGLMAAGSPFLDENGQNPFSDSDSAESAPVEPGQNNAYAANYADKAGEQDEFRIRLAHRGGTLMLVGIFSAVMTLTSLAVGALALIVVVCLGSWALFSGLSDLGAMKLGRMNDTGRGQTRAAVFVSGVALLGAIGIVVYQALL